MTFNHTHREQGEKERGREREWDKHERRVTEQARDRQRKERGRQTKAPRRSEENGKSLFSWKPAERVAESDKKDDSPSPLPPV